MMKVRAFVNGDVVHVTARPVINAENTGKNQFRVLQSKVTESLSTEPVVKTNPNLFVVEGAAG